LKICKARIVACRAAPDATNAIGAQSARNPMSDAMGDCAHVDEAQSTATASGLRSRLSNEEAAMRFALGFVVVAGLALGACPRAPAGEDDGAAGWEEAQSLRELPAGIQALLGVGLGAAGGIADRGERFNVSDVAGDNLPMRRFALAIVHGDTAVVALEQGGRGYSVRTVEFQQVGMTWQAVRCAALLGVPRRGSDLLAALGAHPLHTGLPCRGSDAPLDAAAAEVGRVAADKPLAPPVHPHLKQRPGA
jgi:hypothetical protein